MKLYEISDQFKELEKLEDIDQETLNDTLESLTAEFSDKSLSVASYFLNLDSDIAQLKEAEKRMTDRRKAIENRSKSLKDYLLSNMQRLEISEISCPEFKITIRKPRQVVEVTDLDALSSVFKNEKTVITADKKMIKIHLDDGGELLNARLVDGKTSLIIK